MPENRSDFQLAVLAIEAARRGNTDTIMPPELSPEEGTEWQAAFHLCEKIQAERLPLVVVPHAADPSSLEAAKLF